MNFQTTSRWFFKSPLRQLRIEIRKKKERNKKGERKKKKETNKKKERKKKKHKEKDHQNIHISKTYQESMKLNQASPIPVYKMCKICLYNI